VILALDLYRREGRNPPQASIDEVSEQLRSLPIESHLASNPRFRNPTGVYLKVANFVALDPSTGTRGMTRGSRLDAEVFAEFWAQPERLQEAAEAIRANLNQPPDYDAAEDGVEEAPEGRLLTREHRVRERSPALVRKKKAQVLRERGRLACEACDFDFSASYGERGQGFIECHHLKPVRFLKPGAKTKLDDLALLCANCHRMVHVRSPWLSVDEVRALVERQRSS
jgi:5-methylcytosine-specific restriction protein A